MAGFFVFKYILIVKTLSQFSGYLIYVIVIRINYAT